MTTVLDPIDRAISDETFDGGVRWFNNTNGNTDRAYRIYNSVSSDTLPLFGKTNGLGDIEAMCNAAPFQVGNRVWNDTNGNGRQDPGEANIQVSLSNFGRIRRVMA